MIGSKIIKSRHYVEDGEIEELAEVSVASAALEARLEETRVIGHAAPRADGYQKVSASAEYTFDVALPHTAHARVLRSPQSHARVLKVDSSRAEKLPGVLAVISHVNTEAMPWPDYFDSFVFDPHLRYAGEEVAAVAAESEAIAEEALALIDVEYEILPFVTDTMKALHKDSSPFHDEGRLVFGESVTYDRGDVSSPDPAPDVLLEDTYTTQVVVHNPLEPRCSVVKWDGDSLTVWESTQGIYALREAIAASLRMPQSRVRVLAPYVGGGFGCKLSAGKHTVIAAMLARAIGRPVRFALDRKEMNLCAGNRPDSIQKLKVGAREDGTLVSMTLTSHGSSGAYRYDAGTYWPVMSMYKCPNVKMEAFSVYTNLGKSNAFRAPRHVQGAFALESILDELAERLGMDPLELRIKNHTDVDPLRGWPYTSKKLLDAYKIGADHFGWKKKWKPSGSSPGPIKRGVGLGSQIWWGGGGPPAGATLKLNSDGSLRILAGSQDMGTGTYTILAQVAAEVLEIPLENIEVTLGDTSSGPYCPLSGGSQTAPSVAPAVFDAATQIREALISAAAAVLETSEEELEYHDGVVSVSIDGSGAGSDREKSTSGGGGSRGSGGRGGGQGARDGGEKKGDSEKSRALAISGILGSMHEQTLVRTGLRAANPDKQMIQTFGVQFAEVEVDTWTGKVRVLKIVAAHDIGRPLNRKLIENQFEGGILMGLGQTLLEERVVDEASGHVLSTNLLDYKMPAITDLPEIEVIFVPNEDRSCNNLGVKGAGEPPIIPTAAAIANAVANALGVRIKSLPITPDKVLAALGNIDRRGER